MRIRFGSFELDDERFELTRDGLAIALRPKVFDLLVLLVREHARVVRREEIFERLWSTTAVGFGSLAGLVNELRTALGESGRGPSSIRTVHARGYRFVAPVSFVEAGEPGGQRVRGERAMGTSTASPAAAATPVGEDVPETALDGLRERLTVAVDEIARAGARALVATISGERERWVWLASAAGAAIEAGFRPRFAAAPGGGSDGGGRERASLRELEGQLDGQRGETPVRSCRGRARVPIALCLEVCDPAEWARAGGLGRLLDLLGRAPVLVIAALATGVEGAGVHELHVRDGRIEVVAGGPAAGIRSETGSEEANRFGTDALVRALRGLAHVDRAAFEAALRSLGFEAVRIEPIRTPRRVGPVALRSDGRVDAGAV